MKRMLIGGGLMLLTFLVMVQSSIAGTSSLSGSMAMGILFFTGLVLFYKGKVAGGEGVD